MTSLSTLWRAARAAVTGDDPCPGPVPGHNIDAPQHTLPVGALGLQKMQTGLPPKTQTAWRRIAARFPGLPLGAWGDRSHQARKSCHNTGRAIDIMTRDRAKHREIVAWLLEHRAELDLTLVISWGQKWSAATGWRAAPYRGTSPHRDHVHTSIDCAG